MPVDLSPLQGGDALKMVTTAVAPAVMISATAILIGSVSSKHQSMSERMRALTAEYRQGATAAARRANIRRQVLFFRRRLNYTLYAHVLLFCATGLFIGTVILTSLMQIEWLLICFVAGVSLLLFAVICELLELRLARRTVDLEIADTVGSTHE
jgi:hypothetical protein